MNANLEYTDGAVVDKLYVGTLEKCFKLKPRMNSAYMKKPVEKISVTKLGFESDEHGKYHGGEERAINHFPQEDYEIIKKAFPQCIETLKAEEENGFGENISTIGGNMNFHTICIGDQFRVGSCVLEVAHPRYPCNKVNLRHSVKSGLNTYVLRNGLNGWFYRVIETGEIKRGDTFERISHPNPEWSLYKIQIGLYGYSKQKNKTKEFYESLINLKELADIPWKRDAKRELAKLNES